MQVREGSFACILNPKSETAIRSVCKLLSKKQLQAATMRLILYYVYNRNSDYIGPTTLGDLYLLYSVYRPEIAKSGEQQNQVFVQIILPRAGYFHTLAHKQYAWVQRLPQNPPIGLH